MLFAAFTSAYIVRSAGSRLGSAPDSHAILWVNTAVIAISSVVMEMARRAFLPRGGRWRSGSGCSRPRFSELLFLTGQFVAWGQLAEQGIYLQSHPHSSFFYVLTGVHALHLIAGVVALSVRARARDLVTG